MEEPRNRDNIIGDKEDCASEVLKLIKRYEAAELNRGMVWRKFASRRTGDVEFYMRRLSDQPTGSEDVLQAATEGFDCRLISGIGFRNFSEVEGIHLQLETIWENVDINDIRLAEDYEWRDPVTSNRQMDATNGMEKNVYVVWVRLIKDWSRPDGNMFTLQIFWNGNFSYRQLLLKLLHDQNTPNSIRIIHQHFTLHPQLRKQHIARYQTHPFAAAISAVDSSPNVTISRELVASRGGVDGNVEALLCVVCQEPISVGCGAKQLPCNHVFHKGCILEWFFRRLRCPVCRTRFHENAQSSVSVESREQ